MSLSFGQQTVNTIKNIVDNLWIPVTISEGLNELDQRDNCPSCEPTKTKQADSNVFCHFPAATSALSGPESDDVEYGWKDEGEGGAGERSDEGNHQFQLWHGRRNRNWKH